MIGKVISIDGEELGEIELPSFFEEEIRPDLIRRAFLSSLSARIQPWGTNVLAGKRTTAESWGPRHGVSRVPRIKGSRYHAAGRGALAPGTYGGRRAHPPKPQKRIWEKINRKEKKLAIRSAISATASKEWVKSRGHVLGEVNLPIICDDSISEVERTRDVVNVFSKIGVMDDVLRAKKRRKIRAGKGKTRGRKYKKAKGPLVVLGSPGRFFLAARNLPGVDVVSATELGVEHLAPGGHPGRLTLWTPAAIESLKERLGD